MDESDSNLNARELLIQNICSRLPADIAAILGDALSTRRGANFGTTDPEVMRLLAELRSMDEPPHLGDHERTT